MAKKLYVGNLSYAITQEELANLFSEVGEVTSAVLITDRDTGRSKGFGFVEMATEEEAQTAIEQLNDREVGGRTIKVNEARPRQQSGGGGRGGGGGRRRGGGGGGGRHSGGGPRDRRRRD